MELRPGYKQTELGALPGEWRVMPFSEVFEFRNGVNADKQAYGKGTPFINVLEVITKAHLYATDIPGRVSLSRNTVDSFAVHRGDLVFNRTSETQEEVGLASVYLDDAPAVFGGFVIRGRPTCDAVDPVYSGYAFRAPAVRAQIIARGQGAIRSNIGQSDLRQILAPLPPLLEQRAIADALQDADELLAALERLITKKRGLKLAAMQELLTAQTRLPGFGGEWKMKRLGEVAEIVSGGTPRTGVASYWDGGIKWCTPTDITGTAGKYLSETERTISKAGLDSCSATLLPAGALLLCSRATIGELKIAACDICTNQGFKSLIPKEGVSNEYLYYLLLTMKSQLIERAIGSTFLEISKKDVASLAFPLPPFAEQAVIVAVLSDIDTEIAALEERLVKIQALKQGMMQELLTGRTRLVL